MTKATAPLEAVKEFLTSPQKLLTDGKRVAAPFENLDTIIARGNDTVYGLPANV